jgi:RNA polymerase sigma-70 factor (ECF subfamily)
VTDDIRQRIVELLPRLRRFAYVLTGDSDKGDDLVQETCARALSRLDQWQPGTRLDSWMFRIAQTQWFDRLRAQKVRGETLDLDAAGEMAGEDGRKVTETRLTLAKVQEGIQLLPPEQKVLIALVIIDGRSYKEVADILGIPIGTVMSRLARARLNLFHYVEGDVPGNTTKKAESRRGRAE